MASETNPDKASTQFTTARVAQIIDGLCDRFEAAWKEGGGDLAVMLREAPPGGRADLLVELGAIELFYRRQRLPDGDSAAEVDADAVWNEFVNSYPGLVGELGPVRASIETLLGSHDGADVGRTEAGNVEVVRDGMPATEECSPALHIRCPHCREPVELLPDASYDDVTCRSCGSSFSLIRREDEAECQASIKELGRFHLVARLGTGGFGSVWKAHDPELDRMVAVKIPRRGNLRAVEIEHFFREARAAAQLRHPNIVPVHEIGRHGDTIFIVSELVHGETLSSWAANQQLPIGDVASLGAVIADALHHAHQQGVIHRDLKPANIMIDAHGQPHIMDFGLAKRELGEVTMTVDGQILGTAAYMSPEQAAGKSHWTDCRSDIYALGVILFQMSTGDLPFRGSREMHILRKQSDDAPDPRRLNRRIPADFATVVLQCLERDPNRRYAAADELAAELRRIAVGEPVLARPISRATRILRWARRKPALATATALTLLVALAGPATAVVISLKNRQLQRNLAERTQLIAVQGQELNRLRTQTEELAADNRRLRGTVPGLPSGAPGWRKGLVLEVLNRHRQHALSLTEADDKSPADKLLVHLALTRLLAAAEEIDDALIHGEQALEILAYIRDDRPDEVRFAVALARCHELLADLHAQQGNVNTAKEFGQRALTIRRDLAAGGNAPPDNPLGLIIAHRQAHPPAADENDLLDQLRVEHALSEEVIAAWPLSPQDFYEAACRLTDRDGLYKSRTAGGR